MANWKLFFQNRMMMGRIFIALLFFSCLNCAQAQLETLSYKEVNFSDLPESYQEKLQDWKDSGFYKNPFNLLSLGTILIYRGKDVEGNFLLKFANDHYLEKNAALYHMMSVQNTKNGNYNLAVEHLDSAATYSSEIYGYYGWVMLYYYRDYERALTYLNLFDELTPNFTDFPIGENIHYLRGLACLQLMDFQQASKWLERYIQEEKEKGKLDWIDYAVYYYLGIAYENLSRKKDAIAQYNMAIDGQKKFPEATYRLALNSSNKRSKERLLQLALQQLNDGFGLTDVYVERFHAVYPQEIMEVLKSLK